MKLKLPSIGIKEMLKELIRNGSGHSSKTASLLCGTLTGCICVLLITVYLGYDVFLDGKIDTDMVSLAALITSYAAFAVGVAYPKVAGEKYLNDTKTKSNNKEGEH